MVRPLAVPEPTAFLELSFVAYTPSTILQIVLSSFTTTPTMEPAFLTPVTVPAFKLYLIVALAATRPAIPPTLLLPVIVPVFRQLLNVVPLFFSGSDNEIKLVIPPI